MLTNKIPRMARPRIISRGCKRPWLRGAKVGWLIDVLLESEVTVNEPRAGESYEVGDILIDVLSPFELTGNLNDDSISMGITYGDVRLLTTGDAEQIGRAHV